MKISCVSNGDSFMPITLSHNKKSSVLRYVKLNEINLIYMM